MDCIVVGRYLDLILNFSHPRRGTLIYVFGIIILVDGILVIDGIGIILCTLVRYYVT